MQKEFYIKNMVCDRCKMAVETIFKKLNATPLQIELGKVNAEISEDFSIPTLRKNLQESGFELLENNNLQLSEKIKAKLITLINNQKNVKNFSAFLAQELGRDYAFLSKTFKKTEGQTVEQFFIRLKIEKAKELIQMNQLSFSEIAYQLGYNSISHLSGQFKSVTGNTMSHYKNNKNWNRKPLDKIL